MAEKLPVIPPFVRGDTPLFQIAPKVSGVAADITGYTGYLTITLNKNPTSNADAFLHVTMVTDETNSIFSHQFSTDETEGFDPNQIYYVDVQINKVPRTTNNFTILRATFQPITDYSIGIT